MPIDYRRYPRNWRAFSDFIRLERAQGRCECTGQCGLHPPNPKTRRCIERHHHAAKFARGLVRLTTAHLCQCDPPCANPAHVIAACQRCHLRIDRPLHTAHRRAKLQNTKEAQTPRTPNPSLTTSAAAQEAGQTHSSPSATRSSA